MNSRLPVCWQQPSATQTVLMTNAEGLFWLHSDRTYIGPACRRIPVSARVLVDLLGLTFTASDDDIVAHLVLSTHTHHALLTRDRQSFTVVYGYLRSFTVITVFYAVTTNRTRRTG